MINEEIKQKTFIDNNQTIVDDKANEFRSTHSSIASQTGLASLNGDLFFYTTIFYR